MLGPTEALHLLLKAMAGLTPTQKTALRNKSDRAAQAREGSARSRVEVSPGSESGARTKDLSTHVSIAGVPLRLKSSHDVETVNELVRMVDEKIRQALPLTKTGSIQNASILAALNMAEELLILKRRARELIDGLEARVTRVTEDLEKSGPTA
jgi:cell division protein ZapA